MSNRFFFLAALKKLFFFFRIAVAQPDLEKDEEPFCERLKDLFINTVKANFYPTIFTLFAGALFVGLYYAVSSVQDGLDAFSEFGTTNLGLAFPMITTGKNLRPLFFFLRKNNFPKHIKIPILKRTSSMVNHTPICGRKFAV